jgi:molybdate transport system substrate-binding protein
MSRKDASVVTLWVAAVVFLPGCVGPRAVATAEQATEAPALELTVFAAASLTEAFTEAARAFEAAHPGLAVAFNFAGSQALRTQIEEGAVADVFASASWIEIEPLIASGHVGPTDSQAFAGNRLVVILPRGNPAGIENLEDLARPGLKLVLAAEQVPVGRYSREALANLGESLGPSYAESVLANVVSNEDNVRQVVAKVSLGEADAGIVYATDATVDPNLATLAIEDPYNVIASYPMAALRGATHPELAEQFVAFVLSQEGQAILAGYGFLPPTPGAR